MRKVNLAKNLKRAGFNIESSKVSKLLFLITLIINIAISLYVIFFFWKSDFHFLYTGIILLLIWLFAFFVILFLSWLILHAIIDLRIFKRKRGIEEVLPDFLQLTAANIRAGMTSDKALWYALRPRFGILAKEIEQVAKGTISGESLPHALRKLSHKYDSQLFRRSMNLLIEGMEAGGELGGILNKVAANIQETIILKKEMSANVTAYVVFIGAAVLFAEPILLALSQQLLVILGAIGSNVLGSADAPTMGLFTFGAMTLDPGDFTIFSYFTLTITAFISAMMIATIKKGNVREGLRYIPVFIIVSLGVFWLSLKLFGAVFGGLFVF